MTRQAVKVGRRVLCRTKQEPVWGQVLDIRGKGDYAIVAVRFEHPDYNDPEECMRVLYKKALEATLA